MVNITQMKKTTLRQAALKLALVALALFAPLGLRAQQTLTVYDGTSTNGYIPVYGYYVDGSIVSQFIMPADSLTAMQWDTINKLTFYAAADKNWGAAQFEVYMTEVDYTTFSSTTLVDWTTMDKVMNAASLGISGNQMVVNLDAPYQYTGGNLLIGIKQTVSGNYSSCSWYGVTATGASLGGNNTGSQQNFLPKTTFDYEPGEAPTCRQPGQITLGTAGATQYPISWTAGDEETSWNVYLMQGGSPVAGYNPLVVNTTPSCTFSGLTAGTTYDVAIEAICGSEVSDQCTKSFTTALCEASDMCEISIYRTDSYNDSWNGGSIAIMQNGNLVATVDCPSGSSGTTVNYAVCKGVPVSFVFTRGYYPHEIGVTITDGGGEVVYEATNMSSVSDGTFLTINNACPSCYKVLNLTHSDETTDGVTLTWEADTRNDAGVTYTIFNVTDNVVYASGVTATSQVISGLNENTPYVFTVTTDCGSDDLADAVTVNFTTQASCPAPMVSLTENSEYAHGATITWTDMSSSSYNVRWQVNNSITVDFESGSLPDGWTANTTSTSSGVQNNQGRDNSYGFRFNYSENGATLVSPVLSGTENGVNFSFYYRRYSNSYTEGFKVGYNTDGSDDFSYGDEISVTNTDSWLQYENSFPAGTKRIAIQYVYHNAYYLHIDDIDITIPNDNWSSENTSNTSHYFTGLTPETSYLAQVQSVCGSEVSSWSESVSFTTAVACVAPTSLAKVGNEEARQVALTWNENGANTSWQICLNGDEENLITVTGATHDDEWHVSYTLTGLTPDQDYAVKVRSNCGEEGFSQWSNTINIHTAVACQAPTTLANGTPAPEQVELTWVKTGEETAWQICVNNDEENLIAVAEADLDGFNTETNVATYTLTGLTPSESYEVKVRANCGNEDGQSAWSNTISFDAAASCPAPVLEASGITDITAHTANVAWTGFPENDSYKVWYRTAEYIDGTSEEFGTSLPSGWSAYTGLLSGSTATLTTSNYAWSFGTINGVFDNHARVNIYSNNQKWLVTPEILLPADATLNFDLALTAYSGTLVAPATSGTDDKFIVLISNDDMATWTTLREWNNSGSTYVYNDIANTATGENVNIDLSTYSGQTVKVAFYGESTTSNADNNLHIDNVTIGATVPAGTLLSKDVDAPATSTTLTGLDPETLYEVYVTGHCATGDVTTDASATQTFTTTIACPAPVLADVDPATITTTAATLTWTGSAASNFTVAYKADGETDFTEVQNVTGSPFTFDDNTLLPGKVYTVKVKAVCGQNGDFDDGESEWSNEKTFTTGCEAVAAQGWSENFDSYTAANGFLPTCWNRINEGTSYTSYPYVYGYNSNSLSNDLYFYTYGSSTSTNIDDQYAVLPEMTGLAGLRITMQVRGYNATSSFKVGTMTDNTDASTFTEIVNDGNPAISTSYQEYKFDIPTNTTDRYLAIMMPKPTSTSSTTYGIYVDDISIDEIPACEMPTNPAVTANGYEATFTWVSDADNYEVVYSTSATADPDELTPATVTSEEFVETMTAFGDYYFWVRANCGANGYSEWAGPASVHIGYCVPTLTSATTTYYISNFTTTGGVTNIDNPTTGAGHSYSDFYDSYSASAYPGLTVNFTITIAGGSSHGSAIWVDWNNDMTFSEDERVYHTTSYTASPHNGSFTVPTDATLGDYRMRIVSDYYSSNPSNPCSASTGEFEDYKLTIVETPSYNKDIYANQWYAISSPVHNDGNDQTLAGVTNLTSDAAYDLYGYDEVDATWTKPTTVLEQGKGYIYRRAADATLSFTGVANSIVSDYTLSYGCTADDALKGFNLVGNPYPQAATPNMVYYKLNPNGTWTAQTSGSVAVCEAVLVQTNGAGNSVSFTPGGIATSNYNALTFTMSNGEFEDVAYVSFDNGESLRKIGHLAANAPELSIPVEGARYAIATLGSEAEGFALQFRAVSGEYTLNASHLNGLAYCHLIDRATGRDIDLLRQPSYTFSTTGNDAARFYVKLTPDGENGSSTFVVVNGEQLTVSGEGRLEVYDMMGRRITERNIDGQTTVDKSDLGISGTGVYVLRMGEKSQKIVVK